MTVIQDGAFLRTPLIAGNWKMNMDHVQGITLLQKLAWTLQDANHDFGRVEVAVLPPFTDLRGVQTLVNGDELPVRYGGQDLSVHDSGAYTGEISGQFLAKLGCSYVLVGHSERRALHDEGAELLQGKIQAALRHGLVPIVCVGEDLEVRQSGRHVDFTINQLKETLAGLSADQVKGLVIAYEPVWAIGTGEVASEHDAQEMCAALRGFIASEYSSEAAEGARLLYGGSVKAGNAAATLGQKDVDGVLVGGASLDAVEFANIVRFEHHVVA